MRKLDSSLHCPSCSGELRPKVLCCDACDLKVEGSFQFNEFATLSSEDLHFLRVFVQCEGRVREMEAALGLSYPTIRNRITRLKEKVTQPVDTSSPKERDEGEIHGILEKLEKNELSFEEAMKRIRVIRNQKGNV